MTYGDRARGEATKADGVYLEVRNQILFGVLEPGSRIDYVQLSASLGVLITPLREALRRLEADHLVTRVAHRDVIVAPLTREEAAGLVQVRRGARPARRAVAASEMTAGGSRPRGIWSKPGRAGGAGLPARGRAPGGGGRPRLNVNRAFHRMVYCGSHDAVLIQYRDAISTRTERYVILARQINKVASESFLLLHERLLAALQERDPEAAADGDAGALPGP